MKLGSTHESSYDGLAGLKRWPLYVALLIACVDIVALTAASLPPLYPWRVGMVRAGWVGAPGPIAMTATCLLAAIAVGVAAPRRAMLTSFAASAGLMALVAVAFGWVAGSGRPRIDGATLDLRLFVGFLVAGLVGGFLAFFLSWPIIAAARHRVWRRDIDSGDGFLVRLGGWRTPIVVLAIGFCRYPRPAVMLAPVVTGLVAWAIGGLRRRRRREHLERILRDEDDELHARLPSTIDRKARWWVRGAGEVLEIAPRIGPLVTYRGPPAASATSFANCVDVSGVWYPVGVPKLFQTMVDAEHVTDEPRS